MKEIPPLRAHDYYGRDPKLRVRDDERLRMVKAALQSHRRPTPKPPIGLPRETPALSPECDDYVPFRDEAGGIYT